MQALFKCEICGFISTMQLTGVVEKTICPGCRKLTYTDRLTRWEEAVVFLRSIRWRFVAPLVLVSALSGAAAVLALKHLPAPPPAAEEDQAWLAAAFEKALLEEGVPSLRAELAALRGRDARLLEAYGAAFNQTEVVMPYKSWPEVEAVEDPIERLMLQLLYKKDGEARAKNEAQFNCIKLQEEAKLLRSAVKPIQSERIERLREKEAYEKEISRLKENLQIIKSKVVLVQPADEKRR